VRLGRRYFIALGLVVLIGVTYPVWWIFTGAYYYLVAEYTERGLLRANDEAIELIEQAAKSALGRESDLDLSSTKLGQNQTIEELDKFLWRDARFENIDYIFEQENREEALEALKQQTSSGVVPASNWAGSRLVRGCHRQYNISAWRDPSKKPLQVFGSVWESCEQPSHGPVPVLKSKR
jgi:hypothetical protein